MRSRRATVRLANPAETMASFTPVAKNDIACREATAYTWGQPVIRGATIPMPFGGK